MSADISLDAEVQSVVATTSSTAQSRRPKKSCKRRPSTVQSQMEEDPSLEAALTGFISQSTKTRQLLANQSAEELSFAGFAHRFQKLPKPIQSYVHLQISQIFFNAENRNVPPTPIIQLPPVVATAPTQSNLSLPATVVYSAHSNMSQMTGHQIGQEDVTQACNFSRTSDIISTAYNIANL